VIMPFIALLVILFSWQANAASLSSCTSPEIDDTDPSVIYSFNNWGGGGFKNGAPDYMQTEHYSNFCFPSTFPIKGAKTVVNFSGTGITWVGKTGPNYGIASYAIDGGTPKTIDTYSASQQFKVPNATFLGLSNGPHALTVELTCNKNGASNDYYEVIDAFIINGVPLAPSQGAVAGYNSPALSYSSGWACGGNPTDLSGGHCWNNAMNASVSWTFIGSLIEVFGRPDLEDGIFNVYIDGSQVATVDSHYGKVDNDALNAYPLWIGKVPQGTHTIKLVNTGSRDSAASNSYLQFDEFVAF
jgi:hypothetical protein